MDSKLQQALDALNTAMLDLDTVISDVFSNDSLEPSDAAKLIVAIHELKAGMGDVYAGASMKAIQYFSERQMDDVDIDGNRIEIRSAADRKKWDNEKLVAAVSRRLVESSIDLDTGEMTMTPQEMAERIFDFVQPSYWRVKELSKLGLNADSFCEVGEHRTNLIVRKAK